MNAITLRSGKQLDEPKGLHGEEDKGLSQTRAKKY